jgi:hypothetical protein
MRASMQERFPTDNELCGVLIGSSSRDDNTRILSEIEQRLDQTDDNTIRHITITWMSIRSQLDAHSTMAKCILSSYDRAQQTRDILERIQPPGSQHLTTRQFQLKVIPPEADQTYDSILSKTITSQFSALESTTMVSFSNFEHCDPFTLVPTMTLMANSDPLSPNTETMASLILHGQLITKEGIILTSPVTRVAADSTGTRIYLFAPKTGASDLLTFAEHLHVLLPTWTNQMGKFILLELNDIKRALRESHQIHTPTTSQQSIPESQSTNPPQQPPATAVTHNEYPPYPPPRMPPYFTDTQYAHLNDQLSALSQRLDHNDSALTEILMAIRNPPIPAQTEWTETIVSAITPAILNESDSIRAHQLTTSSTQQTQLMIPIDLQTQAISDQTALLQAHIKSSTLTQATYLQNTEQTNTLLTNMCSEASLIRQNVTKLIDTVATTSTQSTPSTAPLEYPTQESPSIRDPLDTPPPHIDYEVDVDRPLPTKGDCTACHTYTEDLKICSDCQLPFDYQCILSITHKVTNTYDYQCINCHRKSHPHPTQSDGLSESSEKDSDESSTVRGSTHGSPISLSGPLDPMGDPHEESHQDAPSDSKSTTSHDTHASLTHTDLPPKPLRPKSATTARITSTRKSPQKTRNYIKAADKPPDNNHE